MALGPGPSLAGTQVTSQTLTFSIDWNAEIRGREGLCGAEARGSNPSDPGLRIPRRGPIGLPASCVAVGGCSLCHSGLFLTPPRACSHSDSPRLHLEQRVGHSSIRSPGVLYPGPRQARRVGAAADSGVVATVLRFELSSR